MRIVKIPLLCLILCLILVIALAGQSQAQSYRCDNITKSSFDILRIPFFCGRPGDTVLVPVILEQDSIVTSFQFLIHYDTTWLKPVYVRDSSCALYEGTNCISWNVDTTYIDHEITGRMLITDTTNGEFGPVIDTINQFTINRFQGLPDVMACNAVPEFLTLDTLPPGNDTIFYVKMEVDPAMPHGTLSAFTFFESDIFIVDDTVFPPDTTYFNGCNTSQMVTSWGVTADSSIDYQVYPNTDLGYTFWFECDTSCVPAAPSPAVVFTANPTTVSTNQSTVLGWTSSNADSVVIRLSGVRLTDASNGATAGSISWSSPSAGTFNFTATAYGGGQTAVSPASVVVSSGGTGGDPPNVTVTGLMASYNQGELVNFTVSATNTDGSQITITASSLPTNASFGTSGSVVGYSPVSGAFSWTPDFNQSGTFTVRFTASSTGGVTDRYVSIAIEKLQYDRLFSTSQVGNRPVGGLRGTEGIRFPIDLVTSQTVYGVQFDMAYPSYVVRVDSFQTSDRIPEYVIYDNIGVTPGEIRVMTFGLANQPVMDTNTTAIMYVYLTLDSSAVAWTDYIISLTDGRESVNPDPAFGSLPLVTDSGIVVVDSLGDVNLDRSIDVADVVNIVAYIIGNFALPDRNFTTADVIENDSVNVFDLVADINTVFEEVLPSLSPAPSPDYADMSLVYGDMTNGSSDVLIVRSQIPEAVAGVQFELNYDPTLVSLGTPRVTADDPNFALSANDNGQGRLTLLLYNFAPYYADNHLQAGEVDLVEIPITAYGEIKANDNTKIRLTDALMSNAVAGAIPVNGINPPLPTTFTLSQNYPNPFNPSTTIRFQLGVSQSGATAQKVRLDIFNILGQQVTTLIDGEYPVGEYEVVWNATDDGGQRVATGVYLYRLRVGDDNRTKKMLFLK
jgi:hypothetical protein